MLMVQGGVKVEVFLPLAEGARQRQDKGSEKSEIHDKEEKRGQKSMVYYGQRIVRAG